MVVATSGSWVMPLMTGAYIDLIGLSGADAGFLISAEMAAMAVGTFLAAALLKKSGPRNLAIAGAFIVVVGNVGSAEFSQQLIIYLRTFTGLGEGILYASGSATLARLTTPDRAFAFAFVVQGLVAAGLLASLPYGMAWFGLQGLFLSLAVVAALGTFAFFGLPTQRAHQNGLHTQAANTRALLFRSVVSFTLGIMLLVAILEFSMWSHAEQLAGETGMDLQSVGLVLGLSTICGLLGGIAAGALGTQFGRTGPISAAIVIQLACSLMCIYVHLPWIYAAGFFGWSFCLFFPVSLLVWHGLGPGSGGSMCRHGKRYAGDRSDCRASDFCQRGEWYRLHRIVRSTSIVLSRCPGFTLGRQN